MQRILKSVLIVLTLSITAALWPSSGSSEAGATNAALAPRIVRLDPRFDQLVPKDAVIEKLADGFSWVEGPVWNRSENFLLFSDVPNNRIVKWNQDEGASDFLQRSGYTGTQVFEGREPGSNGLAFDSEGRLVFCQHGDRSISRLEADGRRTILAGDYMGKRINSPNDVIFKSNGDIYFTDPPFGLPKSFDDPAREVDFCGVYRIAKNGQVELLTKEVQAPNGIAFSPDEKTLFVSDSKRTLWLAFDVRPNGTLSKSRVVYDGNKVGNGKPGVADGLKIDAAGNIFGAGPGGIYVIAPDGTLLGMFDFGVATGNCAWGEDGSTLFIASNTAIYRVRLTTKGAGF